MVQLRRYLFFFENAKNLGRSDDTKRRKEDDGLNAYELKLDTFILV